MAEQGLLDRITVECVGENPYIGNTYSPCQWDDCEKHGYNYKGRLDEAGITMSNPSEGLACVHACCEKHAILQFGKEIVIRRLSKGEPKKATKHKTRAIPTFGNNIVWGIDSAVSTIEIVTRKTFPKLTITTKAYPRILP